MKKKSAALVLSLAILGNAALSWADPVLINGAGSTFDFVIFSKWFDTYHNSHPNVQINYQSIGSGGGIRQLVAKTVDFGASDGPMTDEQLAGAPDAILHFPVIMGGDVAVYNVEGVADKLNISQKAIAGIFLGTITSWNDPEIQSVNPTLKLPGAAIVVVHRSDGSGTTYCWVDFLSKISPEWAKKVGKGTSVSWPTGLGGKGNEGVSGLVKQTPNSIGYVELGYALQNKMTYANLQNKAGKFVDCTADTVSKAAASAKMPADFRVSITNAPGAESYPAATFSWILLYQNPQDKAKAKTFVDVMHWVLKDGQKYAVDLGYAPLPESVATKADAALVKIKL